MYIVDSMPQRNGFDKLYKITSIHYRNMSSEPEELILNVINERETVQYNISHLKFNYMTSRSTMSYRNFKQRIGYTKQEAIANYIKFYILKCEEWKSVGEKFPLSDRKLLKMNRYKKLLAKYYSEELI